MTSESFVSLKPPDAACLPVERENVMASADALMCSSVTDEHAARNAVANIHIIMNRAKVVISHLFKLLLQRYDKNFIRPNIGPTSARCWADLGAGSARGRFVNIFRSARGPIFGPRGPFLCQVFLTFFNFVSPCRPHFMAS